MPESPDELGMTIEQMAAPAPSHSIELPEEIHGSYIKTIGKSVFIVLYQHGQRKMIMTDRLGLSLLIAKMVAALYNPNNNVDGVSYKRDRS